MRSLRILTIALLALVGAFLVWNWYSWHRMSRGYEVDPETQISYLRTQLTEDFGYSGFDSTSLQKAWVNGFSDHTYLFLISPTSTDFKSAIEKVAGTEPISAPYFRDGGYLGPATAPRWWDTVKIDAADALYFQKESHLWRFTRIGGHLYVVLSAA
jgi:hypothetical protein